MKAKLIFIKTILAIATCFSTYNYAEDIELYVNHNVELDEKPRVLVIFDTSGSMAFSTRTGNSCGYNYSTGKYRQCSDSRLGVAKDAMTQLVNDNDDIDFGLMRFNGSSGGYVMARLGSSGAKVVNQIKKLPADGATPLTETLWEAYLYITGKNVYYGKNTNNRDFSAEKNRRYISPFKPVAGEPLRCDNSVNIILMTDGDPSNDSNRNSDINNLHRAYFSSNGPVVSNSYLTALSRIIHGTDDVKIDLYPETSTILDTGRVYSIGFGSGMSSSGKKLLSDAAKVYGGGQYLHADTAEQLSAALKKTITQIREVNGSFTSPSVASNNADQTRSRESVYYAMFYPESGARWRGNLKKLKVSGEQIIDSAGNAALDDEGVIAKTARTFWLPKNSPADGNTVQQGGVNEYLSNVAISSRKVLTDAGSKGLVAFNKANVVATFGNENQAARRFGVNKNELNDTINWARGFDVDNEDSDASTSDQRDDIFGDPLHSKPVTIDYGNDDVRILIGTNAGFLHMFKDQNDNLSESWAFIPNSLYDIIDPIRKNKANTKVYGVDGPISIFFDDKDKDGVVNKSDRVWVFFGLRRGGDSYYGLDVTNPDAPKLMWGGALNSSNSDFAELAQTWSKPTVSYINLDGYKNKPVLIFGAGYDTNKDNTNRTNDKRGRDVYIVDAASGQQIWSLREDTDYAGQHSIAADVSILDSDYDGYVDRLYASDTGGNVWRIDMPANKPWSYFKLAELGGAEATQDRRFFYKPMVARTLYSKVTEQIVNGEKKIVRQDTPFDAILLSSGNRSKPTDTATQDRLFMIRDSNTVTQSFTKDNTPDVITTDDLMNMNNDPFGNALTDVDKFTEQEITLGKSKGWYYNLPASGEKSLAAPTVIGGVAYFTSYTPASDTATVNQCSLSGGNGQLYAFHLHYGTKVYDELSFITTNDLPDTPQLYFGETVVESTNEDGNEPKPESKFIILGPSLKNEANPFTPKEIKGPALNFKDGKIELVSDEKPVGFGFKTQQTYIYKREVNEKYIID